MPTPLFVIFLPLLVAFLTTFLLVPQVRRFAIEWRLGDKPNGRKLHAHAIPHLGGIAIFGGFFLALLAILATPAGKALAGRILALLPGLLILFGLGLVDDLRGLRATAKLAYQSLGAVCVVGMGAGLYPGGTSDLVFGLLALVSVLWYVGLCNSVNLIDGLDGLAAGTSVIAAIGFLVVAFSVGDAAVGLVAISLIGALIAFLRFNFHPARIFMGDTGSMFIGFTLAFLGCLLVPHVGFWTALTGSAAILGVPILDTTSTIIRRLFSRRHIFQADGEHTHHKLIRIGLSHRGSVIALYLLSALFTVLGTGVFLGKAAWFFWAIALGLVSSGGIAVLARRNASKYVPALELARGGAVVAAASVEKEDDRAPVHPAVVPAVAHKPVKPKTEILTGLPPAASSQR